MGVAQIQPYAPSEYVATGFLGIERLINDQELALRTATWRLYNIAPAVSEMSATVMGEEAISDTGTIGAWADGTTKTALPVSADLASKITNYTVLLIENELVSVKSVNRSANTIEVYERGYGITTGAAHANNTVAKIISYNMILGVKDIESRVFGNTEHEYYVAKTTVPAVTFTKEDMSIRRKNFGTKGLESYVSYQLNRMDKDLFITLNKSIIYSSGQKGAVGMPGSFVGLLEEAAQRGITVASFGALTDVEKFNDAFDVSQARGGIANFVLCGQKAFNAIQKWANASNIMVSVPDRLQMTVGAASVKGIVTKIGTLVPVFDLAMPNDKIVVGNTADLFYAPLVGFEIPGADRTLAQESSRNDQQFTADSIAQGMTYYLNSSKNMTLITGITY